MKKIFTFLIAILLPFGAFASDAPTIDILADGDASLYEQIFLLQNEEEISAAQKLEKQLNDPLLMNEVLYQRYISDTYRTRGKELVAWMEKYYDMPGADRMVKLAKIKQATVRKAYIPRTISGGASIETAQSETWTAKKYSGDTNTKINQFKRAIRSGSTKRARLILEDSSFKRKLTESDYGRLAGRLSFIYYTNGEYELAKKWGFVAADAKSEYGLWAMGLLYYKEEKFDEIEIYPYFLMFNEHMLVSILEKHADWSYEEEVRLFIPNILVDNQNTSGHKNVFSIKPKAIYITSKCPKMNRILLSSIAYKKNIDFYIMSYDVNNHTMKSQKINHNDLLEEIKYNTKDAILDYLQQNITNSD